MYSPYISVLVTGLCTFLYKMIGASTCITYRSGASVDVKMFGIILDIVHHIVNYMIYTV